MFIIAFIITVFCTEYTCAKNPREVFYKKEVQARASANDTEVVEKKASDGSRGSFDCMVTCSGHPACVAVNDFNNGTCELVLSGQFTSQADPRSSLYYAECPPGYDYFFHTGEPIGGLTIPSCYKFIRGARTWQATRDICLHFGGDLVSIETPEEQNHIRNIINSDPIISSESKYWTSGSDVTQEGTWRWMATGALVIYTSWNGNEPNNYDNQDCMVLGRGANWSWLDKKCGDTHGGGVCEIPVITV